MVTISVVFSCVNMVTEISVEKMVCERSVSWIDPRDNANSTGSVHEMDFKKQPLTAFLGNSRHRNLHKKPKKMPLLASILIFLKLCMLAKYNQKYRSFEKGSYVLVSGKIK